MKTIAMKKSEVSDRNAMLLGPDQTAARRESGLALRSSCHSSPDLTRLPRPKPAILVAVDFRPASLKAMKHAAALAKRLDTSLVVLHVVEPGDSGGLLNLVTRQKVRREARQRALEKIQALAHSQTDEHIPVECVVRTGLPEYEILQLAARRDVALIILGHHPRNFVGRWLWGSVSDDLIDLAPCPVVVVNPQAPIPRRSVFG